MRHAPHQNALTAVIRGLAAEKSPACLLDTQGNFLFVNEAWDRRARQGGDPRAPSGASLIGTSWLDRIDGAELRHLHAALLARALRTRSPGALPLRQVAEANTPTTAALLSLRVEPVLQAGAPLALRVVHTVVRERPIEEVYEVSHRPADTYRGPGGELLQCACCRRVRDPADPERWDLVPALLAVPPRAAFTLCALCAELHCQPAEDG